MLCERTCRTRECRPTQRRFSSQRAAQRLSAHEKPWRARLHQSRTLALDEVVTLSLRHTCVERLSVCAGRELDKRGSKNRVNAAARSEGAPRTEVRSGLRETLNVWSSTAARLPLCRC